MRGGPLAEARRWLDDRSEDLREAGRTFIAESVARAQRALRLKQAAVATIAVLAVAAGVFAVVAQALRGQAEESFDVATLALQQVGEMTEVIGQAKAEQPEVVELKRGIAERAITFYERLDNPRAEQRLEEAVARYRLGNIFVVDGMSDAAFLAFDEAIQILEVLTQGDPDNVRYRQELANAHHWRGEGHWRASEWPEAEVAYRQALPTLQELAEGSSDTATRQLHLFELGRTLNGLGIVLRRQARWDDAEASFEEARASFDRAIAGSAEATGVPSNYRQGLAWAHTNLAELYDGWGNDLAGVDATGAEAKSGHAVEEYQAAIRTLEELEAPSRELELELATNYNNLANLLTRRDEDASAANEEAITLLEGLADAVPDIRDELGRAYLARGFEELYLERDDDAGRFWEDALQIFSGLAQEEAIQDYLNRKAQALFYLDVYLEDGEAREELCRLLPELSENNRNQYTESCP